MGSPVIVAPTTALATFSPQNPQLIGTALYSVVYNRTPTDKLSMFKSLDNGVTWNEMDVAHRPTISGAMTPVWIYNNAGLILVAASSGAASGDPFFIQLFSTTTDTWGAQVATGLAGTMEATPAFAIFNPVPNEMVIVGDFDALSFGASLRAGYYRINASTGAVISGPIGCGETINTGDAWFPRQMFIGASNSVWFTFNQSPTSGLGNQELVVQNLSSTHVLGTKITIDTFANLPAPGPDANTMINAFSNSTRVALCWSPLNNNTRILQCSLASFPSGLNLQALPAGNLSSVSTALIIVQGITVLFRNELDTIDGTFTLTYRLDPTGTSFDPAQLIYQPYTINQFVNVSGDGFMTGALNNGGSGIMATGATFDTEFILALAAFPSSLSIAKLSGVAGALILASASSGALCRFARPTKDRRSGYPIITNKELMKLS